MLSTNVQAYPGRRFPISRNAVSRVFFRVPLLVTKVPTKSRKEETAFFEIATSPGIKNGIFRYSLPVRRILTDLI